MRISVNYSNYDHFDEKYLENKYKDRIANAELF